MAALTLAEAQKLDQNDLRAGVVETLITRSPILERLPFVSFTGDNYEFNRENTRGSAVWADIDEVLTTESSTFTNVTYAMRYLYRQVDIPHPIIRGLSSLVDQTMVQMDQAMLSVRDAFLDSFYYGDNDDNSKEPDGVHDLVDAITVPTGASRPRVQRGSGSSGQALRVQDMENMMYTLMKQGVDMITMHSVVYRLLATAVKSTTVSGTINFEPNEFGVFVPKFNGVDLVIDDSIRTTETVSSGAYSAPTGGTDISSVFFFRFGDTMFHGAQQTAGMQVEGPLLLHDKDSVRFRIKWYVLPAILHSLYGAGKIDGIDTSTAVTG